MLPSIIWNLCSGNLFFFFLLEIQYFFPKKKRYLVREIWNNFLTLPPRRKRIWLLKFGSDICFICCYELWILIVKRFLKSQESRICHWYTGIGKRICNCHRYANGCQFRGDLLGRHYCWLYGCLNCWQFCAKWNFNEARDIKSKGYFH